MINLTEHAVKKLQQLLSSDENQGAKIRIYVQGGGCSGFSYGFAIEDDQQEDDLIFTEDNVNVLIDPISLAYLEGITVDYKSDINGERFAIQNPKAASTCGCGSSFSPY
jgi:iron-sulfur cluster insertion protein